jgi:hypothetical protein
MPAGGQGIKTPMLISWCREWPMHCKINSVESLRIKDRCIHLPSQNGTTGWHYQTGLKFPHNLLSFQGKMIPVLWST